MDTYTTLLEVVATLEKILSQPSLPTSSASLGPSHRVLPTDVPQLDLSQIHFPPGRSTLTPKDHPLSTVAEHLTTSVLPHLNLSSLSPHYYGFVTGGATPASLLADLLACVYDQNVSVHLPTDTLASGLEAATLNVLLDLFDLPRATWGVGRGYTGSGTFTTGATASNVLGVALGREYIVNTALQRAGIDMTVNGDGLSTCLAALNVDRIQILSTHPHSSLTKACSILGLGRNNVISVSAPQDPLTIDLPTLAAHLARPSTLSIIAVSAGEVNSSAFATGAETMAAVRALATQHNAWIHVDGAFGLFARLLPSTPEYAVLRSGVAGLDLADSITGDCHKLLNVPYDCGIFFTRHRALAEEVCRNGNAAYLAGGGGGGGDGIQSPLNIGLENSRRFRALPVYAGLITYGRAGYTDMLARQVALARRLARYLFRSPHFDVLPQLGGAGAGAGAGADGGNSISNSNSNGIGDGQGHDNGHGDADEAEEAFVRRTFMIVLFRATDPALNDELVARINATGRIYVSGTAWEGEKATRVAVSNWRAEEGHWEVVSGVLEDVVRTWTSERGA